MAAARIHLLRSQKQKLIKEANAALEKVRVAAEAASRELTAEEQAEQDDFDSKIDACSAQIKLEERRLERDAELNSMAEAREVAAPTPVPRSGPVEVGAPNSLQDEKKGFQNQTEFLRCVMKAGRRGGVDERLKVLAQVGTDEHDTGDAAYLLPVAFSPTMLSIQPEDDPIAPRVTQVPMSAPRVQIASRVDEDHRTSVSGGLIVTRRPEKGGMSASKFETRAITLAADSLFGLAFATEELLQDSAISFIAVLQSGFREQFASHLVDERLNGTGVGQFLGALKSKARIVIGKGAAAAGEILYENALAMRAQVWGYARAIWTANHDCYPTLAQMKFVVGTGGQAMYQQSAVEGRPDLLLGRPIYYTESNETVGEEGDLACINWSQYIEGTYAPLESAESIHVRFENHEHTFKTWLRNAAAPWWRASLIPKKSPKKMSPIVVLEKRN